MLGICTEELHTNWPLNFVEVEILARPLVAPKDSFSGNKFGREDIRTVLLAQLPEDFVRYSSHRSEIKGEVAGKPWERRGHVDLSIMRRSLQQARYFILHVFQFIEPQLRVGHNETSPVGPCS